jgi:hypothetical protein
MVLLKILGSKSTTVLSVLDGAEKINRDLLKKSYFLQCVAGDCRIFMD